MLRPWATLARPRPEVQSQEAGTMRRWTKANFWLSAAFSR